MPHASLCFQRITSIQKRPRKQRFLSNNLVTEVYFENLSEYNFKKGNNALVNRRKNVWNLEETLNEFSNFFEN